jgi:acylphosphatase
VLISGEVQGVYFRDTCRRVATGHGVGGWVRNLGDGRVEAVFEGPAEQVGQLVAWAHQGPSSAVVAEVVVRDEQPEGLTEFGIR